MKATVLKPFACCISLLLIVVCSVLHANASSMPIQSGDGSSSAQKAEARIISGVVLDAQTKEPLIGATIMDRNSNIGTTTDLDGKYSIKITPSTKELTISFVGYVPSKVKIGSDNTLNVLLDASSEMLNEVVVTGIQSIERGRATGAFSILGQDDMSNIYSTSLTEKLEGAVPGLFVDKNNDFST